MNISKTLLENAKLQYIIKPEIANEVLVFDKDVCTIKKEIDDTSDQSTIIVSLSRGIKEIIISVDLKSMRIKVTFNNIVKYIGSLQTQRYLIIRR